MAIDHGLPFSPGIAKICESAVSSDPILMGGPSGRKYSSLREATQGIAHHSDLQHWQQISSNGLPAKEMSSEMLRRYGLSSDFEDFIRFVKQVWEEWQVVPFDRNLSLRHILHHITL